MTDFLKGISKIGESMSAVISAEVTAKAIEDRAEK
tara:strand:- start:253 stop:357 length:105 start_codon:yes stop_codon:yes gene_type:complete